jgi:hypothetical protein
MKARTQDLRNTRDNFFIRTPPAPIPNKRKAAAPVENYHPALFSENTIIDTTSHNLT